MYEKEEAGKWKRRKKTLWTRAAQFNAGTRATFFKFRSVRGAPGLKYV